MTMANAKSTTICPPPPYSREARYQQAVTLLRERILPHEADIREFWDTSIEDDRELFSLDYLRSCIRLPLPPTPQPPPPLPRKYKHLPIRWTTISSIGRAFGDVPYVRLAGQWLRDAGFEVGTSVSVKIEHGRLVLEPAPIGQTAESVVP
jgi:hypothetical protein